MNTLIHGKLGPTGDWKILNNGNNTRYDEPMT